MLVLYGMLGEDKEAQIINDLLEKENISNTGIFKNKNFKTISKREFFLIIFKLQELIKKIKTINLILQIKIFHKSKSKFLVVIY